MAIPKYANLILDPDLEAKINTFLPSGNKVKIIIAGGSRGEQQLIPAIFDSRTNLETVNIAIDIGGIVPFLHTNTKYNYIDTSKIIVMSFSCLLTNDGAYKNWYYSQSELTEMGLLNQLKLFKMDFPENWYRRMALIWDDIIHPKRGKRLSRDDSRLKTKGFLPEGKPYNLKKLAEMDLNPKTTENLFYRRPNNNGIRKQVFVDTFNEFAQIGSKIILIQPPLAPAWRKIIGENYMHQMELDFTELLKKFAKQYENVYCVDFYTQQQAAFTNDYFNDATHLNERGAEIYTDALIDSLLYRGLLE